MRGECQKNVIRLMGRRKFEEKIRDGAENQAEVVFRSFGDIRMVVAPFEEYPEEKTEYFGEISECIKEDKGYIREETHSACIYDFRNSCVRGGMVAENNFSKLYGTQIYGYENSISEKIYDAEQEQEKFGAALKQTGIIMPPRLFATEHIADADMLDCGDYFSDKNIFNCIEKFNKIASPKNGYRLTNTCWEGGAVAAFYPGVLRRIGMLLKEDFYIAFPSPDEARIHPVTDTDVRQIGRAIRKSNKKMAGSAPFDIVTDRVYRYCRNIKMLKEVEFYEW